MPLERTNAVHSIKARCSERRRLQHSQPHARHGKQHTLDMSETLAVFQLLMSWLKALLL
jgi:hypothetical protein